MKTITKDQSGLLHLPMAIALILVTLFTVGTLGLLIRWHHLAKTQMTLDRRVGAQARKLKALQKQIEFTNRIITADRAAIVTAVAAPQLLPALKEALTAEAMVQDGLLLRWKAEQARWFVRWAPSILPDAGWSRPPPDVIGEQALVLDPDRSRIVIELNKGGRASAAEVTRDESNHWIARYARPSALMRFFRASHD